MYIYDSEILYKYVVNMLEVRRTIHVSWGCMYQKKLRELDFF